MQGYKVMRANIQSSPSLLCSLPFNLQREADAYLPYETGIEIECHCIDPWELDKQLRKIDGILEASSESDEVRIRLTTGIRGMRALEQALVIITERCQLNPGSGIHYHIDCRGCFGNILEFSMVKIRRDDNWILKALDSWNYKGNYNSRSIGECKSHWVRLCKTYLTLEFRIGEMTFDYTLILQRIKSAQNIVHKIKELSLMSPKGASPKRTKSDRNTALQQTRKMKKLRYRLHHKFGLRNNKKMQLPKIVGHIHTADIDDSWTG